ncbi:hypothetical protein P3X46_035119 [Hevea brasiliensis]|uniref:Uncharacterized GPI-anchored protein At5g19230-like domain-containing protein n=1 Tax=Hevea brasiliensis TaxID=3981 RepID=A0ABQ9KAQ3_HEVBR|nr:uncharacterized GPI-anchored protein At3g06035-like [Hevea brasiliensis]KAJ9131463.1 hypothetical protein P3X46_035119 [Hevea brasiliensis]
MASPKLGLLLFVLLHAIFLLSPPVLSDGEEDIVLQGLNSYSTSSGLPAFTNNEKASCLADKIAERVLEHQICSASANSNSIQLANYPDLLLYCGINVTHISDGAVLPVCVPKLVPTLVLAGYTQTRYANYINDLKFTGAGIASEDDWMVVILSTNTPEGSFTAGSHSLISTTEGHFAGANSLVKVDFGYCLVSFLLGMLVNAQVPLAWL